MNDFLFPVIFIGHGSPTNAIEDNEFSRAWIKLGRQLPKPRAILCVSAHWQTRGSKTTAMPQPRTIYDFYGFPPEFYQVTYPAAGSPELAARISNLLQLSDGLDLKWGLDHGCWSVLKHLFPLADVPVVQLSLDYDLVESEHYRLAQALAPLRRKEVLVVCSGTMVHNLRNINWEGSPYDWAIEEDVRLAKYILEGDHPALIAYPHSSSAARMAVPTNEHYLPLLYALALQEKQEPLKFFAEQVTYGSLSMRGVVIGA
jgi:4,5-DOPA dioxygenase extradiol